MPRYADIVLVVDVLDHNGVNPKNRPCLVLSSNDEILAGSPTITVACITGLIPGRPQPADTVAMTFHPHGRGRTGLKKPSVVDGRWIIEIKPDRILGKPIGHNPPNEMLKVALMMKRIVDGSG